MGKHRFLKNQRLKKQPAKKIYIYVNAEHTEPHYFKHIANLCLENHKIEPEIIKLAGFTVKSLINTIKDRDEFKIGNKDSGDLFFAIFDIDESISLAGKSTIDTIIIPAMTLAKKKGITCIYSNVCFELWILLHLGNYKSSYDSIDQNGLFDEVNILWKRKFGGTCYKKNISKSHFDSIHKEFEKANQRVINLRNPSKILSSDLNLYGKQFTNVNDLVKLLLQ